VLKTAGVAAAAVDKMRDAVIGRGKRPLIDSHPARCHKAASEVAEWATRRIRTMSAADAEVVRDLGLDGSLSGYATGIAIPYRPRAAY
jgi:hypothetical protein